MSVTEGRHREPWRRRWRSDIANLFSAPGRASALVLAVALPLSLVEVVAWPGALTRLMVILIGIVGVFLAGDSRIARGAVRHGALRAPLLMILVLAAAGVLYMRAPDEKLGPLVVLTVLWQQVVGPLQRALSSANVHPNEVAGALASLIPYAVSYSLCCVTTGRSSQTWKRVALFGLLAGSLMLLIAQSRSAIVAALTGTIATILALRNVGKPATRRVGLSLAAASVAVLVILWAANWFQTTGEGEGTLPSRFELWNIGLHLASQHPFTGVGLGQTDLVIHTVAPPRYTPADTVIPHVHNYLLQLILDLGVFGAFAVVLLFTSLLAQLARRRSPHVNGEIDSAAAGLLGGLLSFQIYGITDAIAIGARGGLVIWGLLWLSVLTIRLRFGPEESECADRPADPFADINNRLQPTGLRPDKS